MPRYFMHLRDGTEELLDSEGIDYDSLDAMRTAVLVTVRDLMAGDIHYGVLDLRFRIDAEDANGTIVYTMPFRHAVNIIPDSQKPSLSPRKSVSGGTPVPPLARWSRSDAPRLRDA